MRVCFIMSFAKKIQGNTISSALKAVALQERIKSSFEVLQNKERMRNSLVSYSFPFAEQPYYHLFNTSLLDL